MGAIGLTGGIACGKSSVCGKLAQLPGVRVFDADAEVGKRMATDRDVQGEVARLLGWSTYGNTPEERATLREWTFQSDQNRLDLEALLHPRVRRDLMAAIAEAEKNAAHLVAEIPLLYEAGFVECFSQVVVVAASERIQRERLLLRQWSEALIDRVLLIQWPLSEKMARADYVVWNDGTRATLNPQLDLLTQRIFPAGC